MRSSSASEHAGPDVEIVDLAATHRVLELSGPFAWEVLAAIEGRLADIFAAAATSGVATDAVADAMARRLIGRG